MLIVNKRARAPYLSMIGIHMLNYQIGRLRSFCEFGGEFSGRSVLCASYSEFTHIFMQVS